METVVHSTTGLFHVIMALVAMITGTIVIIKSKGTRLHVAIGYTYFFSMLTMNLSSFMLYGLLGHFGPFHVAAIISLLTLLGGMIPIFFRKKIRAWQRVHGTFMYYSVVGLYAAFFSEILTRIPGQSFSGMVILASVGVTIIGVILFNKLKSRWFRSQKSMSAQ